MKLTHLLKPEHVLLDVQASSREELLSVVARVLEETGAAPDAKELVELLVERERLGPTIVDEETALPHCKVPNLKHIVAAFARSVEAIPWGDASKARLFFFVLSPREQPAAHLQVLAGIARLLRNPRARKVCLGAATREALLGGLGRFDMGAAT